MPITVFTDAEEMLEAMARMRQEALALFSLIPKEVVQALVPGKFALLDGDNYDFPVFYELLAPDPEDRERLDEYPEMIQARGFSIACPEGEFGTLYLSSLLPISADFFAEVKAKLWNISSYEAQTRALSHTRNLIQQLD